MKHYKCSETNISVPNKQVLVFFFVFFKDSFLLRIFVMLIYEFLVGMRKLCYARNASDFFLLHRLGQMRFTASSKFASLKIQKRVTGLFLKFWLSVNTTLVMINHYDDELLGFTLLRTQLFSRYFKFIISGEEQIISYIFWELTVLQIPARPARAGYFEIGISA